MHFVTQLRRENLSDAAEAAIRAMIVDGRLEGGERLNEVHLADRLGVSRTPLREALNRLVHEGAIEARPRLGYFVKPLMLAEFEQLYDVRPILDPAALKVAGIPDAAQLAALEKLNRKFAAARAPQVGIFALVVGMFSVANIMFVSVKERTSIIGIIKALGAKRYIILMEFLIEAIILCIIGGLIGLALVFIILKLISLVIPFAMTMSLTNMAIGVFSSIIVGIISGILLHYRHRVWILWKPSGHDAAITIPPLLMPVDFLDSRYSCA